MSLNLISMDFLSQNSRSIHLTTSIRWTTCSSNIAEIALRFRILAIWCCSVGGIRHAWRCISISYCGWLIHYYWLIGHSISISNRHLLLLDILNILLYWLLNILGTINGKTCILCSSHIINNIWLWLDILLIMMQNLGNLTLYCITKILFSIAIISTNRQLHFFIITNEASSGCN